MFCEVYWLIIKGRLTEEYNGCNIEEFPPEPCRSVYDTTLYAAEPNGYVRYTFPYGSCENHPSEHNLDSDATPVCHLRGI